MDCPFCDRLAHLEKLPEEEVVWRFPQSVALLGSWQFYQGYCLLVARTHARELSGLAAGERRAYLEEMCLLAQGIEASYRPQKLNYELLGNQVPHLHWHLFPRYANDPDALRPVWFAVDRAEQDPELRGKLEIGPQERATIAATLRQSLKGLGAPRV
jgi:diadenosine tetraphosphate (Ap4A) HIT family hydrolase